MDAKVQQCNQKFQGSGNARCKVVCKHAVGGGFKEEQIGTPGGSLGCPAQGSKIHSLDLAPFLLQLSCPLRQ
eukprot:419654-Pelagomonas_calceolata.AAC.10